MAASPPTENVFSCGPIENRRGRAHIAFPVRTGQVYNKLISFGNIRTSPRRRLHALERLTHILSSAEFVEQPRLYGLQVWR
jgi:hypothetical protein